jgi:hypothetical protein
VPSPCTYVAERLDRKKASVSFSFSFSLLFLLFNRMTFCLHIFDKTLWNQSTEIVLLVISTTERNILLKKWRNIIKLEKRRKKENELSVTWFLYLVIIATMFSVKMNLQNCKYKHIYMEQKLLLLLNRTWRELH